MEKTAKLVSVLLGKSQGNFHFLTEMLQGSQKVIPMHYLKSYKCKRNIPQLLPKIVRSTGKVQTCKRMPL